MKLEQYKAWLEKNGNVEEQKAYEVAEAIIEYHKSDWSETEVELFPRKVLANGRERVEFDLLVKLTFKGEKRTTERLIGVEFKEYDTKRVIHQAIVRKQFVDYQYIATRFVMLDYTEIFLLAYFGIGWVVWDESFVKLLVPAKWSSPTVDIHYIVREWLKDAVREVVKQELATLDKFIS